MSFQGASPICKTTRRSSRRSIDKTNILPSHDPFIPRSNAILFDCSTAECKSLKLQSITQVTSPKLVLKSCFEQVRDTYECETIRYNYFKNVDKLLFLSSNTLNKTFYVVDCLVYSDGGRVCHKKDDAESLYPKLVDTGTMARPKELSILAQDEFICEEGQNKEINCDLDPFTPFDNGLKIKEKVKLEGEILLKTGSYVVLLKRNCIDSWCGYSGRVAPSRRADTRYSYEPPGGWVYTCYYAKKQQICKPLYNPGKNEYNERDWIV